MVSGVECVMGGREGGFGRSVSENIPPKVEPKGTPPQTGAERRRRRRAGAAASPV
eukprot:CAMPEP_0119472464 /NCGR_PEP_ID=MMETSP1344-20130328/4515_1 /TAXON_ID=236787 /ORGANISM="Florenciella parvula, Strain CCMP2471" /LENGTH=54 /DNA_ID=CAMNT_0007505417 /DNA_START=210 /DNA_END=371 /DNA_ORIENTATION=-